MPTLIPDKERSVLLVDDHAIVRAGYRRLLAQAHDAWEVVEADSGEMAYRLCGERGFSIIVLDLSLPGMGGIEALRRILQRDRDQRVLVMSMHDQRVFVDQALDAGATGYVTKASAPETLATAIGQVMEGRRFLGPDLEPGQRNQSSADDALHSLSPREFEIFRMLAAGDKVSSIAGRLCISYKTAANCSTRIRRKLAAQGASDLTRMAIRAGVMDV